MTVEKVDAIADWFINRVDRESGETITHLKLQKLLYFAQAWYLANTDEPLFKNEIQAWAHGPVIRSIYDRFAGSGWAAIEPVDKPLKIKPKTERFLELVYDKYGQFGAKHLERLTHEHAPWKDARGDLPSEARCENVISEESMRSFYGAKIKKHRK